MNKNRGFSLITIEKGFSLIEVLVTITILTIVGVAIATIVTRSFQGNSKTELIGNVKQNGQNALAVMEKDIRESDIVICPSTGISKSLVLLSKNSSRYIRFFMFTESSNSNGSIWKEEFSIQTVPTNLALLCDLSQYPFSGTQINLTDQSSKSAISLKDVTNTGFTVIKSPGYKDTVAIQFDLGPAIKSPDSFATSLGGITNSIQFQTTVQIR